MDQGDPGKWPARRDRTSSGSQQEQRIDVLDCSTKHADIILMPNPSHIERRPEASEIWGEKIILQGVRIEGLDLASAQGAEGP